MAASVVERQKHSERVVDGEAGAILQPNGDINAKACLPEEEPRER